VILRDVKAIQKGKRPGHSFSDFNRLLSVLPRTVLQAGEDKREQRIFYVKLWNELKDLAKLRLPINILYERHVLEFKKLVTTEETKMTEEEKKAMERDTVFSFKDPRLRHLNKDFKREELQVDFVDFGNKEGIKQAIDQIIKFNCMTNEFNYILDIFQHVQTLALTKLGTYDYAGLFTMYDKNLDNLLDKNELRQLIIDCGEKFALATEAEV
jgi:hypothetical protein